MTEAAVELRGVTKVYGERVTALDDVSLGIARGEFASIVGPSGSGKSTLLHILGTLDRPSAGEVWVDGIDAARLPDDDVARLRARSIGFVFQQFFLIDGMSVVENAAMGLLYAGVPASERRSAAVETLERVGLGHRLSHLPNQLSGGEQQRLAIARAVLGSPTILLADEPTGNLDSRTGSEIMALLTELNDLGTTVVVITHDLGVARMAQRRIAIRDGHIEGDERD